MKFINYKFGKMVSAVDRSTGKDYRDWRTKYLDWPGLIVVWDSEHKNPGKQFIYFYPSDLGNPLQPYFHTSLGNVSQDDSRITCTTKNSLYTFWISDGLLSDIERNELMHVLQPQMAQFMEQKHYM